MITTQYNAMITAVGAYLPEDKLTNADLEKMVDTTDEWIMTRVGIKERRILKDPSLGASHLAIQAVNGMLQRYNIDPTTVEGVILATNTADHHFPSTASIVSYETGCKNAFSFDINSACPSWLYALETGSNFIRSGQYKRLIVVATEKMSAAIDYTDRQTSPLFGDGAGCVLLERTDDVSLGVQDAVFHTDGRGREHLIMKSGGSASPATPDTVARREHFVHQDGQHVFKNAVLDMARVSREVMQRNGLTKDDVAWVVPHQANKRIIDAVADYTDVPMDKVMVTIEKYGNISSATIPICLWEYEDQLKKGDKLILSSFGAGYTWGSVYLTWAYDGSSAPQKQ